MRPCVPQPRDPVAAGEDSETRRRVHRALDLLPPKYKAVLTLRDIQGFSCEEIAEIVEHITGGADGVSIDHASSGSSPPPCATGFEDYHRM